MLVLKWMDASDYFLDLNKFPFLVMNLCYGPIKKNLTFLPTIIKMFRNRTVFFKQII